MCVCVCGGGGGLARRTRWIVTFTNVHLDDRFAEVLKGLSFSKEVLLNT